jgi:hypothetical protein
VDCRGKARMMGSRRKCFSNSPRIRIPCPSSPALAVRPSRWISEHQLMAKLPWDILTLLLVTWQADLNDSGHTLHIDTSGSDIGAEEHTLLGLSELFSCFASGGLRHSGVDFPCWVGEVHVGEDLVEYAGGSSSG